MNGVWLDNLFSSQIFPGFPFRNQDWIAIAFERNKYDNTRMPEWFFRSASQHFNPDDKNKLLVKGDCFVLDGLKEVVEIAFTWESYQSFMLSRKGFSLEYKMADENGCCGCWADTELTVFGGVSETMVELFDARGGRKRVLEDVEQEFFLDRKSGNEDMRMFFGGLLFPERRGRT